jgi:hypothetical protein
MSFLEDIVNIFIYSDVHIKNTPDYIGVSVSNENHQFSYVHKKQKQKEKKYKTSNVVYKNK